MKLTKPIVHQTFRNDETREQEGLHDEITPPDILSHSLEERIIGKHGKEEEEDMKMLLRSGMM